MPELATPLSLAGVPRPQPCQGSSAPSHLLQLLLSSHPLLGDPSTAPHVFPRLLFLSLSSILLFKLRYGEGEIAWAKSEIAKQALSLNPVRMKILSKLNNRYKNPRALPCRIIQLFQSCTGFPSTSLGTFLYSGEHWCMWLHKCMLLQRSGLERQILVVLEKTVI